MIVLKALALVAFIFLPGWLAVSLLTGEEEILGDKERFFLSFALGIGIISLSALILALASVYSLYSLLLLVGALGLFMAIMAGRKVLWLREVGLKGILLAILVVITALVLFSPPGRTVFGWSDVGVYPNIAAHIEREGGVELEVSTVKDVGPERRDFLYRANEKPSLPFQAFENKAYFITDFEEGRVVPQFYYLWPSLMAVFSSFLGLEMMFWAVIAMGVLALWGLFLLARRLLGWRWGSAAALIGALSPLMVYFARYTTTEMMNMALFVAFSLCAVSYLQGQDEARPKAAISLARAAAFLLTLGFLCRIDFLVILLPLGLCYFGKRIFSGLTASDWWFCGLALAGGALALVMGALFSPVYFNTIWTTYWDYWGWLIKFPGVLLLAVLVLCFIFASRLREKVRYLYKWRRFFILSLWLSFSAAFIFLYFFRPLGADGLTTYGVMNAAVGSSYVNQTLVRWAWYFSFVGVLFLYLGYALWFTRRGRFSHILLATIGLTFTLIYSWDLRCTPLHILTMRRLVPVVLPMAAVMIAYTLKSLAEVGERVFAGRSWGMWLGRAAAGAVLLYLVLFSVNASIPSVGLEEGGNQLELCGDIAERVGEDGVVLMDYHLGDLFGPPLRSFYGVENAWIMDNTRLAEDDFLELLGDLGFPLRPVYLLWRPEMSGEEIALVEDVKVYDGYKYISWEEMLEKSFMHRPDRRLYYSYEVLLYPLGEE